MTNVKCGNIFTEAISNLSIKETKIIWVFLAKKTMNERVVEELA